MTSVVGKIMGELRDRNDWSQAELAAKSGVSREMIGKYERGEAVPSVDAAKKIADAFEVSMDYLVGEGIHSRFDKKTLKRFQELDLLDDDKRKPSLTLWTPISAMLKPERLSRNKKTY